MIYKLSVLTIVCFLFLECSNGKQKSNSHVAIPVPEETPTAIDSNAIKVYVEKDGKIKADGNEISLPNLDSVFGKLKARNGIVYYSRANGQGEPPPNAMEVIELVAKHSLPVKLFTDNTFTEIVRPN